MMTAASSIKDLGTLPSKRRLTIAEYHRMGETGILTEADRVELIEGELIEMAPIGSRHADCVSHLVRRLVRQTEALIRVQDPLELPQHSEPEPDIAIVHNRHYSEAHPGPQDVLLLIEVADSTLAYDRDIKVPLYARFGIAEVWLVDIQNERLEVYLEPSVAGYRQILRPENDESVSPALLPEISLRVAEFWM
jgi:Uma2 family endonuclease